MALGDLYDNIVGLTDEIIENYQGEFGMLSGFKTECAKLEKPILDYINADASWLRANQERISKGSKAISTLIENLVIAYNKTLYKLNNLH